MAHKMQTSLTIRDTGTHENGKVEPICGSLRSCSNKTAIASLSTASDLQEGDSLNIEITDRPQLYKVAVSLPDSGRCDQ